MKTPDEIKKGLECCSKPIGFGACASACPFDDGETDEIYNCTFALSKDALAYINQLESRLAQVERERDAAVNDLTNSAPCFACLQFIRNGGACKGGRRCLDEQFRAEIGFSKYDGEGWQWRGVCEENTKER